LSAVSALPGGIRRIRSIAASMRPASARPDCHPPSLLSPLLLLQLLLRRRPPPLVRPRCFASVLNHQLLSSLLSFVFSGPLSISSLSVPFSLLLLCVLMSRNYSSLCEKYTRWDGEVVAHTSCLNIKKKNKYNEPNSR
jgi:hypothetical protein